MLNQLLNSFEKDEDGWLYYGSIDPKEAAAELEAMRAVIEAARVVDWGAIATVLDEIILDEGDETIVQDIRNFASALDRLQKEMQQ